MNSQSTGSVSIGSANPGDPPIIDPNLLSHSFDRRVLIEGVKEAMGVLSSSKFSPWVQQILRGPRSSEDKDVQVRNEQSLPEVLSNLLY